MVDLTLGVMKDLGTNRQVLDSLPYALVGGIFEGSIMAHADDILWTETLHLTSHIVPHGQQLKILFLRVWTTDTGGAIFQIKQTNPSAAGQTGTVEAYPVMGSVPPYTDGANAIRDYPMLEAAGAEVLHGSLKDPIHVLEGSIDFSLRGYQVTPTGWRYGLAWWGVEELPEG